MKQLLPSVEKTAPLAPLFIRIGVGLSMAVHGYDKYFGEGGPGGMAGGLEEAGVPLPVVSAWLASTAEFVGGIFLLLGAFTRWWAIPVAFTMFVACMMHWSAGYANTYNDEGKFIAGMEYPLTLMLGAIAIFMTGGGKLSVDGLFLDKFIATKFGGSASSDAE